jgi:hypothetical protein
MNDLTILHDAWEVPEPPTHGSHARARAMLTARIARRPRPPIPMRLAAAGALAVALATALVVAQNLSTGGSAVPGGPVPVASAQVLERAAKAAERQTFTPPRDDQWIYIQDRFTGHDGRIETQSYWHRADGEGVAYLENGKLHVENLQWPKGRPKPILESYKGLASLPTDPAALLRWAYAQDMENGDTSKDGVVYLLFNHVLRGNILPPELEAAIFRALKQIPGVTLQTVDIFGKPAYSLGFTDDWLHEELLIDPQTYVYRGERSIVVKNTRIDPLKAGNSTGEVRKGSTVIAERLSTAIVDKPGQTR